MTRERVEATLPVAMRSVLLDLCARLGVPAVRWPEVAALVVFLDAAVLIHAAELAPTSRSWSHALEKACDTLDAGDPDTVRKRLARYRVP
ncbi:MAG: hypothetical protein DMD60_05115 [Gemmatimonadetes bacterium]|nr:MAG: hypothetical protein DMD60_05115 [Gemmatimonadota bacterium]